MIAALAVAAALAAAPAVSGTPSAPPAKPRIVDTAEQIALLQPALEAHFTPEVHRYPAGVFRRDLVELAKSDRAARSALLRLAGETAEAGFDFETAQGDFTAAAAAALSPVDRAAALLGLARLQLFSDPVAAARTLLATAAEPRAAAVADVYRARLAMAAGDRAAAITLLGKAMAAAAALGTPDSADTLRAALADRAQIAVDTGDLATGASLLALVGAGDEGSPKIEQRFTPACDLANGLTEADGAIFEVRGYAGIPDTAALVRLDRPGSVRAAAILARALREFRWTGSSALNRGIRVYIACSAAGRWRDNGADDETMARWLAQAGVGPYYNPTLDGDARADADRTRLLALAGRDGPAALSLVPVLLALAENASLSDDERRGYRERALAILTANDAPAPVLLPVRLRLAFPRAADRAADDPLTIVSRFPGALATLSATDRASRVALRLRIILAGARRATGDNDGAEADYRAIIAEADRDRPALDPLRRVASYELARLLDAGGRRDDATAIRRAAMIATNLCEDADNPPGGGNIAIRGDDYPVPARKASVDGFVLVARQVGADGSHGGGRIVYSQPPGLFDAASLAPVAASRSPPPLRGGLPFACAASALPIRWRLENVGGN
ncbi:hypothetical protein IP88_15820 [alpha proteobacterium AAP81b]|nr:hypothetical protein IP88_15820 [alpha proteobacterium AAP81b]